MLISQLFYVMNKQAFLYSCVLLHCVFSPQSLVNREAREVEETQILFCYHTAEVIAGGARKEKKIQGKNTANGKKYNQQKSCHSHVAGSVWAVGP